MDGVTEFLTIRQTAARGVLTEHHLRLLHAQGRLPGIVTGNRFLVNLPLLNEQLEAESRRNASGAIFASEKGGAEQ